LVIDAVHPFDVADELLRDLLEVMRTDRTAQVQNATFFLKLARDPAQSRIATALQPAFDG